MRRVAAPGIGPTRLSRPHRAAPRLARPRSSRRRGRAQSPGDRKTRPSAGTHFLRPDPPRPPSSRALSRTLRTRRPRPGVFRRGWAEGRSPRRSAPREPDSGQTPGRRRLRTKTRGNGKPPVNQSSGARWRRHGSRRSPPDRAPRRSVRANSHASHSPKARRKCKRGHVKSNSRARRPCRSRLRRHCRVRCPRAAPKANPSVRRPAGWREAVSRRRGGRFLVPDGEAAGDGRSRAGDALENRSHRVEIFGN
jgi:hypothetical protein